MLGTIGATFFVIGLGLLYQVTGTLNMLDIHDRLAGRDDKVVRAAFAFVVTGLGLKLAMFPLHRWLPDAYTFAPSAVTAFLASTATKVAVYAMLRFLFTVFGFEASFMDVAFGVFLVLGLVGMFAASLIAVFRDDVKQMLAFSSVAQIGYMLLGISFATTGGVTAALVHVVNHAFMKAALFLAVGAVFYAVGSHRLSAYKGIGRRMPFTAGCFVVAGLSLVGVPLTAGFVSKFVLIRAALDATLVVPSLVIVFAIVASSLLAVAYIGRVAYEMFLADAEPGAPALHVPRGMLVPMAIVTALNVWVGLDGTGLVAICEAAAESLLARSFGGGRVVTVALEAVLLASLVLPLLGVVGIMLADRSPDLREGGHARHRGPDLRPGADGVRGRGGGESARRSRSSPCCRTRWALASTSPSRSSRWARSSR